MKIGTSVRFFFPAGPQTLEIYQRLVAASPPGAFIERPMGDDDQIVQASNLIDIAKVARRSGLWALIVGDNHAASPAYGRMFQPIPTISRLSAETGDLAIGVVLLAPFYHPLLLAEQLGTLSCFVDAPLIVTVAAGGNPGAFNAFGYSLASRGRRTEELVPPLRALLSGETVTAEGRSFELHEATISPAPRHPTQIWLAGTNDITVERAGRLGDGWLTAQNALDATLAEQLDLYRETALRHDRPILPVLRRDIHLAESDADARAHVDPILAEGYRGVGYDELLVGSPSTVIERLRRYESMGFDHVMVRHITGDHHAMMRSFELLGDVVAAVA